MVYILLGTGFEEIEAVTPGDLLRRAGVEVRYASLDEPAVVGSHGITVQAECRLKDVSLEDMEMLILPGGLRGVRSILDCEDALKLVRRAFECGKYIAAICAAPTILAKLGITEGKPAVCYPGMENQMGDSVIRNCTAVVSDRVITGRSAGAAMDFSLALITVLRGSEAATKVANGIVYQSACHEQ